ncbi:SCO3242 family prenyltransferase [Streptomyces sp. NPDC006335]|uniref:SCO3242 family prenyltransferase n=1 Tax=Streptomyces sp. NPDC006335 TaxID=3156895 RepID=UPI0033A16BFB
MRASRANGASRAVAEGLPERAGEPTAPHGTVIPLLGAASPHTTPPSRAHTSLPHRARSHAGAWAELLRLPALFTVPGDALAGAAAASARPTPRTLLAIASSLCLYEAGMALNDWADRDVDAVERPHRPLPSGRVHPTAALGAACALTGAGLTLAACAGRPALTVAVPLAATVWAYDLALKNTPAGPFAMATARGLDLLLGAAATAGTGAGGRRGGAGGVRGRGGGGTARRTVGVGGGGGVGGTRAWAAVAGEVRAGSEAAAAADTVPGIRQDPRSAPLLGFREVSSPETLLAIRRALPSASLLGSHTLAVTSVSRREAQGGSPLAPLAALAATAVLTRSVTRRPLAADGIDGARRGTGARNPALLAHLTDLAAAAVSRLPSPLRQAGAPISHPGPGPERVDPHVVLRLALAATYATTAARPYFHATLNPSPQLTQRAVTAGIRATIPLQAALAARSGTKGATVTALLTTALAPLAGRFARKVSVT